jgi:tRNA G18 (ribose-2'-O)-methylase SpoU
MLLCCSSPPLSSAVTAPTLNVIRIERLDDPRAAAYANQKDAWLRLRAEPTGTGLPGGLFIAEGEGVVRHLIDSPYRVVSVLVTPERLERTRDALARLPASTPILVAERGVMSTIVGFHIHTGILGAGERGQSRAETDLLASSRTLILLEDLCNHDNVGGIFRNAAALGGPGASVILSPRCCDPLYRKSLRVSMGHVLRVPFARSSDWPTTLDAVRIAGFTIAALTPQEPAMPVETLGSSGARIALAVGTEGAGLSTGLLQAAAVRVRIAMAPGVDSLNASAATAIALHRLGLIQTDDDRHALGAGLPIGS